jgi:hypothetical protein
MSIADYDYGLEDKILRKNIPGRYSTWEDEEPERRARGDEEHDDGDARNGRHTAPSSSSSSAEVPSASARDGPQTGSKGVLADYREHCAMEAESRRSDNAEALSAWRQAAFGAMRAPASESSAAVRAEDEDIELAVLRQRRLMEMRAAEVFKPVFGQVRDVTPMELLSAIDDEVQRAHVSFRAALRSARSAFAFVSAGAVAIVCNVVERCRPC